MADAKLKREIKHFKKTYKSYIPGKLTEDDLVIAFLKGYNAADMYHRNKRTEADDTVTEEIEE